MIILIISVLVIAGLIFFKSKNIKQKFLTVFFVGLILFALISFNAVFGDGNVEVKTFSDVGKVVKLYFSWVGSVFDNLKTITAQVTHMNWQGNKTT